MVVFLLGDAVVRAGIGDAVLLAPWPLLALWFVYVSSFASSLEVDDDGATVQNLLRVVRIPWARVQELEWRWQVEFRLDDDTRVRAIGGPLEGRGSRRPGRREDTPENVRAQFAYVERLYESRDAASRSDTDAVSVRRSWDVPALVALAVLVVWAAAAVMITGGAA